MGFNKIVKDREAKEAPQRKEFKPTTPKELKEIEKRARQSDREKSDEKSKRKEERKKTSKLPRSQDDIRNAIDENKPIKVFKPQLFEMFLEHCKTIDERPPAYRLYEKESEADESFMYDVQQCLARMSWQQLAQLASRGIGDKPLPTRSWTDAFRIALHIMVCAFGVEDYLDASKGDGMCHITDRDALDEWPVSPRQRRSKSDNEEEKTMHTDEDNRKLRAMGGDDDDEDEEPKGRHASADDDDEDEEDEKPKHKKAKAGKSFGGKKRAASRDEDEDEDEDEKPRKRKASRDEDEDEDEKPAAKVVITDRTVLAKVKSRDKGGMKTKLLDLVPKKGMSVRDILAKAKEEGIGSAKAKKALITLHGYGYLSAK